MKDYFDQEGKRSTLGITVRAHDIKEKDCGMISCLRTGGLIPFVRSNAAQATLSEAPYNHLYGWSKSVWNDRRSVGSSSSGEAGLLSSFCSPIGMGSDIGSSVRNPAEFNGITSLKPCSQRFSTSREYSTYISIDLEIFLIFFLEMIQLPQFLVLWPVQLRIWLFG